MTPTLKASGKLMPAMQISAGVFILAVFLFFRPLTVAFYQIGSYSILDIYGVSVSYLILVGLLIHIQRLRFDFISILIILFCLYCIAGLAWGASYRDIVRTIFPFLPFFLGKAVINNRKSVTWLLEILTLGYIVPIVGSIVMILLGASEVHVTGSMVERQLGLSSGVHVQAHLMFFFSFVFALYFLLENEKKHFRLLMVVLLLGSLFCILKTYTRTVFLGGLFFWFFYLFFWKRRLFFVLLIVSLVLSVFMFDEIKAIFTQEHAISGSNNNFDMNTASSGRLYLWSHNLGLFADLPWLTKLTGVGLGNELTSVPNMVGKRWAGSHNDYISLLVTTGIIGVVLYMMIYGLIFFFLLFSFLPFSLRIFGLAVLLSVMAMNFFSNSYIVRFELAQMFWFLIGLLYALSSIERERREDSKPSI